jgi:hypothetical protein
MSAPVSVGTTQNVSTVFNSGKLTLNGKLIGDIQDININSSFTEKSRYALNTIIKRAIRRSNLNQSVTFNISGGMYRELYSTFFGASSPVTGGLQYNILDGQQGAATMYMTCYEDDDTTKSYQFSVINPVLLNNSMVLASQEFETVAVEVACTEIKQYVDTLVSN